MKWRRLTRPQGAFVYTTHNEGKRAKAREMAGRKYEAPGLMQDEHGAASAALSATGNWLCIFLLLRTAKFNLLLAAQRSRKTFQTDSASEIPE
jgi:hypothetical protein